MKDSENRGNALDRASRKQEGGPVETDLASRVTSVAHFLNAGSDDELFAKIKRRLA